MFASEHIRVKESNFQEKTFTCKAKKAPLFSSSQSEPMLCSV